MSYYDSYGGGTIPKEARASFGIQNDDNYTNNNTKNNTKNNDDRNYYQNVPPTGVARPKYNQNNSQNSGQNARNSSPRTPPPSNSSSEDPFSIFNDADTQLARISRLENAQTRKWSENNEKTGRIPQDGTGRPQITTEPFAFNASRGAPPRLRTNLDLSLSDDDIQHILDRNEYGALGTRNQNNNFSKNGGKNGGKNDTKNENYDQKKSFNKTQFVDKALDKELLTQQYTPGSLFGQQLDLNSPQFGLFSRNMDLERHLFNTDSSKPLFIPYNEEFDQGFSTADRVYKEALADGFFDENRLDGEDNIQEWGITSGKNLDKNKNKVEKAPKFDESDFDEADEELDALYAKLQHISTTPREPTLMNSLEDLKSGKMPPNGQNPFWDGYKVPKLTDLGLNPADAGYSDDDIQELFGEMQFIDGKVARGEELDDHEADYIAPLSEEAILDRMAIIEAKKVWNVERLHQIEQEQKILQQRKKHHAQRRVIQFLNLAIKRLKYRRIFGQPRRRYHRILTQTDDEFELLIRDDIGSPDGRYWLDYNFDPNYRPFSDIEQLDHLNYYTRYTEGIMHPLTFIMEGNMDDLIQYYDGDDYTHRLWDHDDDLDQRADIINNHNNFLAKTSFFSTNPMKEESDWFPATAAQMFEWAPPFDSPDLTREELLLSDMGSFLNEFAL
jgi:hypothetical protein